MFKPRIHENGAPCCCAYNDLTGAPMRPRYLCGACKIYFATLEANDIPRAPDAYAAPLAALRAASAKAETSFAQRYRESGEALLQATRRALDDHFDAHPVEHRTLEELKSYAPPDSYEAGLRALQEKNRDHR